MRARVGRLGVTAVLVAFCSVALAEPPRPDSEGEPISEEVLFEILPPRVLLEVDYPHDGDEIADYICGAFVAGRAEVVTEMDVAIVIDTSLSTIDPSGADIDGDGVTGTGSRRYVESIFDTGIDDRDDSILAAEVAAARRLMAGFNFRKTRVALVAFAGDPRTVFSDRPPRNPPARTLVPLTSDFSKISDALDALLTESPRGATHMAAGLDQAIGELASTDVEGAASRAILFFTDGHPTLPRKPEQNSDAIRETLKAVDRAARAGLRIHSFAIGADALEEPLAVVEMARRTHGRFVPVRRPAQFLDAIEQAQISGLSEVRVTNRRTGKEAPLLRVQEDGTWGAFLILEDGENEIEVAARASDGTETVRSIGVQYQQGAQPAVVDDTLQVIHKTLLSDCLDRERRETHESKVELLRTLRREIEEERAKARQRAAKQRKNLTLSIE